MLSDSTNLKSVDDAVWRAGRSVRNSGAIVRLLAAFHRAGGTVLRYHSVNDDAGWRYDYVQNSLVVPIDVFDRQVGFLARRFRLVGIGDIVDQINSGRRVDSRCVAITFDDGYEDNYRNAFRILKKHDVPATFYVVTSTVADEHVLWTVELRHSIRSCEKPSVCLSFLGERSADISTDGSKEATIKMITGIVKRCKMSEAAEMLEEVREEVGGSGDARSRRIMMNWDEIREMHSFGMTMGAHTYSHFNMPSLDTSDVAQEIVSAKRDLEEELQAPIEHFAYPNGRTDLHCDARTAKLVSVAGFRSAVTSLSGPVTHRVSEYCIPRIGVAPRHRDLARLAADIQYSKFKHQNQHAVNEITRVLPPRASRGGGESANGGSEG